MTSMLYRSFFGSMLFTMSMRMCSLSSSVHGEHSRNTMLNSTHCSSSQELEDISKDLRTIAFIADTTTASRISQARRLPVHFVNASMPRLIFRSDCNDGPPRFCLCRLECTDRGHWPVRPASMKQRHHSSAGSRRQSEVS